MLKYMLVLLMCSTVSAEMIPYQSKELIEIYTRLEHNIYEDLELDHRYEMFDDIFILPNEFYGEAELYDLKFFLDMDNTINNYYDANCYRILYENRTQTSMYTTVIPEPTLIFFAIPFLMINLQKRKLFDR